MVELSIVPEEMKSAAKALNEGELLIVYRDGNTIRCETEYGDDPYVWRDDRWAVMTR
jgi:hypothetical protein